MAEVGDLARFMREPACAISQASWKGGGLSYSRYTLIKGKGNGGKEWDFFPLVHAVLHMDILEHALLEVMKEELNYIPIKN